MERTKILISLGLMIFLISCNKKSENTSNNEMIFSKSDVICDSIVYELPEKTTNTILNMLEDKVVSYCNVSTTENLLYTFSFPYDNKVVHTIRDSLLISKTKTFLKLRNKYYPVVSIYDYTFSNIPRSGGVINDFNYCFVTVNAQGIIENGFAY